VLLVLCLQTVHGRPPWNTFLQFSSYTTPADSVTLTKDNCEQQPHQRYLPSNALPGDVMDGEAGDVNEEDDDVLCSFISSQLHNAGREMFRGADTQQMNDTERVCSISADQQYEHIGALSNSVLSMGAGEDVSEEDEDVLCSFISSQLHNAGRYMFRSADVQQIDDAERICNSSTGNQVHTNSSSHEPHTAEKSHECDVCHKTFKCRRHLMAHKQLHTRVKPLFSKISSKSHECDVCHKIFEYRYQLNAHKRIHGGMKTYGNLPYIVIPP